MINEEFNYVEGETIDEVWRNVMLLCVRNGWDFVVKGGSYEGQIRKQLPFVTLKINKPGTRPLAPIMQPGIPSPTSEEKIEEVYFPEYLMDYGQHSYYGKTLIQKLKIWWHRKNAERKGDNFEQYTYGDFIASQLPEVIDKLIKAKGNTNQACISIGDISTTFLSDPPCLRLISFKVIDGKLWMTVFFRSWDLYAGLPENLGGLQLVKEYVLSQLAEHMDIEDGPIIANSDGLHIYQQYFELSDTLNMDKIVVSDNVYKDKIEFDKKYKSG